MRISDWSSDVCSSDLLWLGGDDVDHARGRVAAEQRALRAAQHFDAFKVEEFGFEQAGRKQRVAVQVDRGRAVAGGADAQVADADVLMNRVRIEDGEIVDRKNTRPNSSH